MKHNGSNRPRKHYSVFTTYNPVAPELEHMKEVIPVYDGTDTRAAFDAVANEIRTFETANFLRANPIALKWFKNDLAFQIHVVSCEVD